MHYYLILISENNLQNLNHIIILRVVRGYLRLSVGSINFHCKKINLPKRIYRTHLKHVSFVMSFVMSFASTYYKIKKMLKICIRK